jgi:hypothetical protein
MNKTGARRRDHALRLTWNFVCLPLTVSRILFLVGFLSQIIICWHFRALTWDDAAITLGFARTFAHTGRIEPTHGSGIVEGYSTTMWMLLMAGAAEFLPTPASLLLFAKLSTLLFNLANLVMIRRWYTSWHSELMGNLVAGTVGCTLMFYESINGMETPLLLTLILCLLLLSSQPTRSSRILYLVAGCALVLVRFEAAWLLIPFVVLDRPRRRAISSAMTWIAFFALSTYIRWCYFGSVLPNTVFAKDGVPYSHFSAALEIRRHLAEPKSILVFIAPMLLGGILLLHYRKKHLGVLSFWALVCRSYVHRSGPLYFCSVFSLCALALSTAIGWNWGPALRSFYPAWPFLLGLAFVPLLPRRGEASSNPIFLWTTLAICTFASVHCGLLVKDLAAQRAPLYMPYATIVRMNAMNSVLRHIQEAAHQQKVLYAGPDMGAIMLYSNNVRVVDLGLLCDPVLSRQRYRAIDSYVLERRHPDIIEVHEKWTALSRFGDYPDFLSNYRPVFVDGVRVFITRKMISRVDPARFQDRPFDADGRAGDTDLRKFPYITYQDQDLQLNRLFGRYLVLN